MTAHYDNNSKEWSFDIMDGKGGCVTAVCHQKGKYPISDNPILKPWVYRIGGNKGYESLILVSNLRNSKKFYYLHAYEIVDVDKPHGPYSSVLEAVIAAHNEISSQPLQVVQMIDSRDFFICVGKLLVKGHCSYLD